MAGTVTKIHSVTAIAATQAAVALPGGRGSHQNATFLVDVRSRGAGDTWDVSMHYKPGAVAVLLADTSAVGLSAVGLADVTLQSPFTSTNRCVPAPNTITVTLTVDGGTPELTADVYAIYGD